MPVNFSTVFDDDPLDILLRRRRQQESDAQRSAAPKQPEMTDTEARSLLDTLGSGAATTLQYVGETLGKPGRAVRGLLAGRPEELLNLLPFSDALGLTDPAKSTSGDDLLDQYDIRPKDREKPDTFLGSVADALPGFATELVTDPLVLFNVGLGSLTSKGASIAKGLVTDAAKASMAFTQRGRSILSNLEGGIGFAGEHILPELAPVSLTPGTSVPLNLGKAAVKKGSAIATDAFPSQLARPGINAAESIAEDASPFAVAVRKALKRQQSPLPPTAPVPGPFGRPSWVDSLSGEPLVTHPPASSLLNDLSPGLTPIGEALPPAQTIAGPFKTPAPVNKFLTLLKRAKKLIGSGESASLSPAASGTFTEEGDILRALGTPVTRTSAVEGSALSPTVTDPLYSTTNPLLTVGEEATLKGRKLARTTGAANIPFTDADFPVKTLEKGWLNQIRAGERSLLGLGGPLTPGGGYPIIGRPVGLEALSGPLVADTLEAVGKGLDYAGRKVIPFYDTLKAGVSKVADKADVIRRYLFNAEAGSAGTRALQDQNIDRAIPQRLWTAANVSDPERQMIEKLLGPKLLSPEKADQTWKAVGDLVERDWRTPSVPHNPADLPILRQAADIMRRATDVWYDAKQAAGASTGGKLPGYASRQSVLPDTKAAASAMERSDALKAFTREEVNRVTSNPNVAGVATEYGETFAGLPEAVRQRAFRETYRSLGSYALESNPDDVMKLAEFASQLPNSLEKQGGLYANPLIEDFHNAGRATARKVYGSDAKAQALIDAARAPAVKGQQVRPLADAIEAAGLDPDVVAANFADRLGRGPDPYAGLSVPRELLKDVTPAVEGPSILDPLNPVLNAAKSFTNVWKGYATGFLPFTAGTAVRNETYNLWANALQEGVNPLDRLARRAIAGDQTPEAIDIARRFSRLSQAPGMSNPDLAGQSIRAVERQIGLDPRTVRGELAKAVTDIPKGYNPLDVKSFAPVKAGHSINALNDEAARLGLFKSLVDKGYTDINAIREVERVFGGQLSNFETQGILPWVPFFRFQRSAIPYSLTELATRPGGASGVGARAAEYARRGDSRFLPDYLGTGLAAPVGKEDETGRRQYLVGLQLPFEQPFELLDKRGIGETGMHLLGQTNPLLRGAIEYFTNRQLYSGRELEDTRLTTPSRLLDQVIASSPLQRPVGVLSKLADPRNYADGGAGLALSLLTGAKVRPVDIAAARQKKAADVIKDELSGKKGVKPVDSIAVSAADLAQMDEADRRLYLLFQALQRKPK